jgi:hypothetical protein
MSPADDRRPSSVLVGALMAEPPLIPDRWNALLVGAVIFGASAFLGGALVVHLLK